MSLPGRQHTGNWAIMQRLHRVVPGHGALVQECLGADVNYRI